MEQFAAVGTGTSGFRRDEWSSSHKLEAIKGMANTLRRSEEMDCEIDVLTIDGNVKRFRERVAEKVAVHISQLHCLARCCHNSRKRIPILKFIWIVAGFRIHPLYYPHISVCCH